MEGSWKVSPVSKPNRAGYRIRIILEAGDIRRLASIWECSKYWSAEHDVDTVAHLGPDLLGDDWTPTSRRRT